MYYTTTKGQLVQIENLTHDNAAFYAIANGTSLSGYIDVSYDELVRAFGEPNESDKYKSDAEWQLVIDGHPVTIYDYKSGVNYNGSNGTPKERNRDWHVGGNRGSEDVDAVTMAMEFVELHDDGTHA